MRRLQVLAQEGQCPYGVAIGAGAVVGVHGIFLQIGYSSRSNVQSLKKADS